MVLRTNDIKDICNALLKSMDSNDSHLLQIAGEGNVLCWSISNNGFYLKMNLSLSEAVDFRATIEAGLFLKLINQLTSETVDMSVAGNALIIKANGVYKFPLVFDDGRIKEIPELRIENPTVNMTIPSNTLKSMVTYNSLEVGKKISNSPVQSMYYVDECGCLTFTSISSCVNNFTLSTPVKMLLNHSVVKVFKLFNDEEDVNFTMGYELLANDLIQTKVKFETANVCVVAALPTNMKELLGQLPVEMMREVATQKYKHTVTVNKQLLLQAINRMLLFNSGSIVACGTFTFKDYSVVLSDDAANNFEEIFYDSKVSSLTTPYVTMLDLNELKSIISSCAEPTVTFTFGNVQAMVILRDNVYNILSEITEG